MLYTEYLNDSFLSYRKLQSDKNKEAFKVGSSFAFDNIFMEFSRKTKALML
jgi:hypothetical protein